MFSLSMLLVIHVSHLRVRSIRLFISDPDRRPQAWLDRHGRPKQKKNTQLLLAQTAILTTCYSVDNRSRSEQLNRSILDAPLV